MNDTIQTLIRSVLKIGAGALVTNGFTDANTAETIVGGIIGIIAVVWGCFHRKPEQTQAQ